MSSEFTMLTDTDERAFSPPRITVNGYALAYLAILVTALVLRLAEIDTVPMMASETHDALAAWRVIMPNAPGEPLVSSSALLFGLQSLSFTLFGGSEIAARLATALGGAALVLLPFVFRRLIGRTEALLVSLLLAFSPVLLLASRTSSPDVWALLLTSASLWALWRSGKRRLDAEQNRFAVLAVVLFAASALLTGASGVALALIVIGAAAIALFWSRNNSASIEGDTVDNRFSAIRRSLGTALPLAALVVLAVSTGLMLYPAGLSAVGEGIGDAIHAVVQPRGIAGYAVLIGLFYEPVLWLLAIAGLVVRRQRLTGIDVFLAAWVVLAVIVSLFFGDGHAGHALWMIVPLAALAARLLAWALSFELTSRHELEVPTWARGLIAVCVLGVLAVFTLAFQSTARSLLDAPPDALTLITPQPQSLVLLLVSVMFLVIGFFLFASLWGGRTSWQGIVLGLAAFGMITSLGSGWHVAVSNAENPAEFWHTQATQGDTALLRETLFEVADRISGGFPLMPISVIAPDDGVIAWLLRDFEHTAYIQDVNEALGAEVLLIPRFVESEVLDSGYVGQDFVVSRTWDASTMTLLDFPAWWTQHRTRTPWTGADEVVLWLRADVYQGVEQVAG